jgi:hypothetical protein
MLVDELARPLVAGPRETEDVGDRAETPVGLGDRASASVEALERGEEHGMDARCRRRHARSVAGEV